MIKGEVIGSNPGQPSSRKLEVNVQGKILKSLPFSNGFKCRHSLKNSEEKIILKFILKVDSVLEGTVSLQPINLTSSLLPAVDVDRDEIGKWCRRRQWQHRISIRWYFKPLR